MSDRRTEDPVNQPNIEFFKQRGAIPLGLLKSREWIDDPRRFLFSQSRYKFVSKMLAGRQNVIEVGCGDAFNAPLVMQEVGALTVTDFDAEFIHDAIARRPPEYPYIAQVHNFLNAPLDGCFDAAYLLDVLEHIDTSREHGFIDNIVSCLSTEAVMIVGMPSLESQAYASPGSREGHVNCKTGPDLKALMQCWFHSVFMFSMNDEVVHTGYHRMAHYLFAVAAHPKNRN